MSRIIAVIPARGGSKRIPKKNIVTFCERPMIAWTIQAAIRSECFDSVFVNTDCPEIAKIAVEHGANVPFLRKDNCDDHSTVSEATAGFIEGLISQGSEFDDICQLLPNCPLRTAPTIQEFLEFYKKRGLPELISCVVPKFGNPQWAILPKNGYPSRFADLHSVQLRSQDLSEMIYPTGAIWLSSKQKILETRSFYSEVFYTKTLSWIEGIDIDTPDELQIAETIMGSQIANTKPE